MIALTVSVLNPVQNLRSRESGTEMPIQSMSAKKHVFHEMTVMDLNGGILMQQDKNAFFNFLSMVA